MESLGTQNPEHGSDHSSSGNTYACSQQNNENSRKRKLSIEQDTIALEPNAKYQLTEKADTLNEVVRSSFPRLNVNLLDLSDEILLMVLTHLDGNSLLPLSMTCSRLKRIIADKTLWTTVDFTSAKLITSQVHQRVKYLQAGSTKTLMLRGMTSLYPAEHWNVPTVTPTILRTIASRSPTLERLELTEAYLDMNEINILMFPCTLRSLVLRKCALSVQNIHDHYMLHNQQMRSFLSNIYKHLIALEELTIEYCSWFDTHDFMVLSKLPNLRYLSLKGCVNIKDCVPYASLATRFGFKKLEVLDLRDTPISDSDVSCFNIVHSLKELMLECPEHLRTERGLQEYNDAERQRVEQLHRLAAPDLNQNEREENNAANQVNVDVAPLNIPPRHGVLEIRIVNEEHPAQLNRLQDNILRIIRRRDDLLQNNQRPPPPAAGGQRPAAPPSPPLVVNIARVFVPAAQQAAQQLPPEDGPAQIAGGRNDNNPNNHNNADRQQIVRIINREMFLQRREPIGWDFAQHRLFPNALRPLVLDPRAARAERDPNAVHGAERPVEPPEIYVQYRPVLNPRQNNNLAQDDGPEPIQQPPQNNPPRHLPHVIIMPGIGQPAPNYVSLVSDRGICAYGVSRNELRGVLIGGPLHPNLTGLERLSVRNYKLVTDTSLDHLESAAPHLKLLDVTGTSVTMEGIRNFKLSRPGCIVLSDYDIS
ncbi:uncharacterized protein LOC128724763 [Anopheles nili]|uniref:uncharacterized protein LOC128724763 n=1 Tax=Anopheles nili TaxID=185578 RepID=UPI00237AA974|nr:uncharacterized protein LOC128724763 [Anopheles nili]